MIITSNINYIVDLLVGLPTRDWICQCKNCCRWTSGDEFLQSSRKPHIQVF